jgi:CelD/BcsL family acetyltransferase involved in cellulose biosynthesis
MNCGSGPARKWAPGDGLGRAGQAQANPLLSYRWFAAAAATLHADATLRVIVVRRDSRLLGIAPMAVERRHGVDRLEIIGAARLQEPAGLLAADEPALQSLCESLIALGQPFVLHRIPPEAGVLLLLSACARGRGIVMSARSAPCLRIEVAGSWEDYLAGRSGQVRTGLRRKRRRSKSSGQSHSIAASIQPNCRPFEEALDVEADGWKAGAVRCDLCGSATLSELARRATDAPHLLSARGRTRGGHEHPARDRPPVLGNQDRLS